mmetsp:Transcript_18767/g.26602  ORF Transcript_18767/g.26602 Transcript_18767/m.26602 type:complete len:175 (-) Transcript_18767:113-637(-)
MSLCMAISLFLSMSSSHNKNAALRLYGPQSMFQHDLVLPAAPLNSVRESNAETLRRLGHDLACIERDELTALDAYRLFGNMAGGKPSWGYCLEAASVPETKEIFVLMRSEETTTVARTLQWVSLSAMQTRKQVERSGSVTYSGPSEEVMQAILYLFRDAFEFAVDTNWSYTKKP